MSTTAIDLHRQGKALTLTDAEVSASAAIALSKLAEAVLQADGGQTWTGNQNAGGFGITSLLDPVNPQDAATRAWVLTQVAGISTTGHTVRVATTASITLTGTQTVDGVALSIGDRVLVKNQATPSQNGIKVVAAGAWTRPTDMDAWTEVPGGLVTVEEGTTNGDTLWLSTADLGGTLDTTSITFTQLPSPTDLLAGAGLTRTGQTINVIAGDASIVANPDEIHVGVSASGAIGAAGALAWLPDNSSLEISSNAARIKAGGVTDAMLASTFVKVSGYIVRETPTGLVNGANTAYTLANTPVVGTEMVFLNGILQEPGAGNDYTISGTAITYLTAPATGDRLRVTYLK